MKVQKYLVPIILYFGISMVAQGTENINKDFEKADWATKSKDKR